MGDPPSSPPAAHLSLDVCDIERSCRFYEALLGVPPRARTFDHARFEHAEPPLVLSLVRVPARGPTPVDHVGLRVGSEAALAPFAERLTHAGISFDRQDEIVCCDSEQTKLWAHDPDGIAWEIYVRNHEVPPARPPVRRTDDVHVERRWVHTIRSPWPDRLELGPATLDEVLLDGTINRREASGKLDALLAECRRVLVIGGTIRLRGLVASSPLPKRALPLPGPAAAVERVPVELEPVSALARAGFVDVTVETLRDRADHAVGTVELREMVVRGVTSPSPDDPRQPVVYLGPFARVTCDRGVTFERGVRTWIASSHADALSSGPLAQSFALTTGSAPATARSREGCCT